MDITAILGIIVAVLGSASAFVAVRHQAVIKEIRELAEVVAEALEDKKITKDEQKEILEEFNELEINKPDPVIKSFFEKAKKFWKSS